MVWQVNVIQMDPAQISLPCLIGYVSHVDTWRFYYLWRRSYLFTFTGLGNHFFFQIIQSYSREIINRLSNHARGWEELHYCTAARTWSQYFVQVKREIWPLHLTKNAVVCSRLVVKILFWLGFKFTKVNTNVHRAESDSCLICVTVMPWKHKPFLLRQAYKLTAQCASLSLIKSHSNSPSRPLSLSFSHSPLRYSTVGFERQAWYKLIVAHLGYGQGDSPRHKFVLGRSVCWCHFCTRGARRERHHSMFRLTCS